MVLDGASRPPENEPVGGRGEKHGPQTIGRAFVVGCGEMRESPARLPIGKRLSGGGTIPGMASRFLPVRWSRWLERQNVSPYDQFSFRRVNRGQGTDARRVATDPRTSPCRDG